MENTVVNLEEKLCKINDYWNPKIVGKLNGQYVKLAKLLGEFIWHKHDDEDELFYVLKGELIMAFRDKQVIIGEHEFFIVPRGVEHKPIAHSEVAVMLFEPASTINTGNKQHELTRKSLESI